MAALIEAATDPAYPAEIVLVLSNRPHAAGLARAAAAGIATAVVDHTAYRERERFEAALQDVLDKHRVELVCLAGFMRVLTPWLLSRWPSRMLNIHPSLLPAFPGLDTHERALAAGTKLHGATVHVVVPDVDAGPIVMQAAVPVDQNDDPDTLAARVLAVEHRIYPLALKLVAEGRVHVADGRCTIDGAEPPSGALIAPEIKR
jgi:phosphoribosylglycinamide formyltransferase-1